MKLDFLKDKIFTFYIIGNSYLCTYDLNVPVGNSFDVGSIYYEGKWEVVGPWKLRLFWPCEMASSRQASAI